jgi:hypothetical protein
VLGCGPLSIRLIIGAGRGRWGVGPVALPPVPPFATNLGHMSAVAAHRLAALATNLCHVLAIFADRRSTFASDLCHVNAVSAHRFSSFATDSCHVAAILADRLATFTPSLSGLLGRKFVCPSLDVGCFSPLASDLTLAFLIHRGESAPRLFIHDAS